VLLGEEAEMAVDVDVGKAMGVGVAGKREDTGERREAEAEGVDTDGDGSLLFSINASGGPSLTVFRNRKDSSWAALFDGEIDSALSAPSTDCVSGNTFDVSDCGGCSTLKTGTGIRERMGSGLCCKGSVLCHSNRGRYH
jgi:hypothetical protein